MTEIERLRRDNATAEADLQAVIGERDDWRRRAEELEDVEDDRDHQRGLAVRAARQRDEWRDRAEARAELHMQAMEQRDEARRQRDEWRRTAERLQETNAAAAARIRDPEGDR